MVAGSELVGLRYQGPFDDLGPGATVEHRVIGWDEVALDEGTGVVHIAPGCGTEDFELSRVESLPVLAPVDESGVFYPAYGWLAGRAAQESAPAIIDDLRDRGLLVEAGTITHRYPECWRCHTPLIFRISDDWFIAVDEIRGPMREANETVEWTPPYMGKRMDDWLVNMSDWNISRRRYYGLPLPFYPCGCGHLTVVGSRAQLAELATVPLDGLEELRRPWIDDIPIRCPGCGDDVHRITEVGDVWLDAGIVPFSTLGWENPEWVPGGYGTGAAAGLTSADLPDHAYWEQWFPADWVSEMREQIRLWFYSQLFMSVALTGQAPYRRVLGYEKMLDENGRAMHGSWGNMIEAEDAFERMGADVMRWQYCAQPPEPEPSVRLRSGSGDPAQAPHALEQRLVPHPVRQHRRLPARPRRPHRARRRELTALDRWLVERTRQLVAEATDAYDGYVTVNALRAFEAFVDDLSNWYVRRSRRRFWDGDEVALRTLWSALVTGLRVIAPVMPFLTEHLWQVLVRRFAPERSGLGVPRRLAGDGAAGCRRPRGDGGRASSGGAGAPGPGVVQDAHPAAPGPARRGGARRRRGPSGRDRRRAPGERRGVRHVEATELRVRPNLPRLGPRLGAALGKVRAALADGELELLPDGGVRVAGHDLGPEDVLVEHIQKEGWAVAASDGATVALDLELDDALRLEGRVYDTIHQVNTLRKDRGLELTDRIELRLPSSDADLLAHAEWLAAETLAVDVSLSHEDQLDLNPS